MHTLLACKLAACWALDQDIKRAANTYASLRANALLRANASTRITFLHSSQPITSLSVCCETCSKGVAETIQPTNFLYIRQHVSSFICLSFIHCMAKDAKQTRFPFKSSSTMAVNCNLYFVTKARSSKAAFSAMLATTSWQEDKQYQLCTLQSCASVPQKRPTWRTVGLAQPFFFVQMELVYRWSVQLSVKRQILPFFQLSKLLK